jgi:hypothetical protein
MAKNVVSVEFLRADLRITDLRVWIGTSRCFDISGLPEFGLDRSSGGVLPSPISSARDLYLRD